MSRTGRWVVAVAVLGISFVVVAGAFGAGPTARLWTTETRLEPQVVSLLGESGDPLAVVVAVNWAKEGYCEGQFEVHATESPTEVRVSTVVSREYDGMECAVRAPPTAWPTCT